MIKNNDYRRRKKNTKCLNCGINIEYIKGKKKYCSDKCRYEFNRNRNNKIMRENYWKKVKPNKKVIKEKRKCKFCNKEFIWSSSQPQQIYCSNECLNEFYKKKLNDLNKGIIRKGNGQIYNHYKLRFEVFKRDNFTCQYCGRNVKEDKIKLHCDHIHPKSKGGLFVANNLITSCEECNLGKRDIILEERQLNKIKLKNVK